MTPIPLPVSDIPTLWWWLVTPGVVLAASAGLVASRIDERLSVPRPRTDTRPSAVRPERLPARKPVAAAA